MIEIDKIFSGIFFQPDELEKTRLKEIKSMIGKIAYSLSVGKNAGKPVVHNGIARAEATLKWIEGIIRE